MTATGGRRVYERYAWIVLLVSAVLGLLAGLTLVFIVLVLFRSFRKGKRWALWLLPVLWLFHFLFSMATVHNLVIAIITAVGLILTHRAFFSVSGEQTSRVS
jgi:hypothetical protein